MSSESKEVKSPSEEGESLTTVTVEDALEAAEDDDTTTAVSTSSAASQSTSKSKKKKKSKLKTLLSHKKDAEVAMAEVADAISSTTLEEKRSLTKEETSKLEAIIRKMNQLTPGGRKDMGDHKFWKTQPVLKFGSNPSKSAGAQILIV
jgi:glycylpeptide N-tetradecanoyltransferase